MKIIDFERRGNVVRLYIGNDDLVEWWGDDWNDRPYEHNAGRVYDQYVAGHVDIAFPFDSLVLEPCDGAFNSEYSKEDMQTRRVPCLIIVPKEVSGDSWYWETFDHWVGADGITKLYFGDEMDTLKDAGIGTLLEWCE